MDLKNMITMIDDKRRPFTEKRISDNVFIRVFNYQAPDHLFKWHKDDKSRIVIVLNDNDWKFQFDNGHPFSMTKGDNIAIPSDYFHRVIKGTTALCLKIVES